MTIIMTYFCYRMDLRWTAAISKWIVLLYVCT